jgi:hypothetical protein
LSRTGFLASALSVLLITGGAAWSAPEAWMRKSRPNELAFALAVEKDCPAKAEHFERLVLRTFALAWIARVPVRLGEPYLQIEVWCYRSDPLYPYAVVARFQQIDGAYAEPRGLGASYESAGAGSYSAIRQEVQFVVQLALEDHIAANFDL